MRLTHRGWFVLAVVGIAVASGLLFGARGLNAVAAPGIVALLAAVVQIKRIEPPVVDRDLPDRAHRGTDVTIRLTIEVERPFGGHVHDEVDDGLIPDGNARNTTVVGQTLEYGVHLQERGNRSIGPTTIIARDVLGLVSEEFRFGRRDRILVLPRIYSLAGPGRQDLAQLFGGAGEQREEFDHLRVYRRGDPLTDIHWKSSAKQPQGDFVVKAFRADPGSETVEIAAEARDGGADEMADATASIAAALLESGLTVGLTTPSGRLLPDAGSAQRGRILTHLATADAGLVSAGDRSEAEIVITATDGRVDVDIDGSIRRFSEFTGESAADQPRPVTAVQ